MARYGLATIFEDHEVGHEFTTADLPLHLTHIDSFETDMVPDELVVKLRDELNHQKVLTVKTLTDELYGTNKDIPVTALELTPELKDLHDRLVQFLDRQGIALRNPQFNRDNYTPHVSIYGSKRVVLGADIQIRDISLATKISEAEDANRQVLVNFMLVV